MDQETRDFIENALREDVGNGDHSSLSCVPKDESGKAKLLVKENGILAGMTIAKDIFEVVDPALKIEPLMKDGDSMKVGDLAFYVEGRSQSILKAERLVLNCMQRMCAVATKTRYFVDLLYGLDTKILDTRKTTPGMRFLEKQAVIIGGGTNHRFGLYDMIMLKDNHIDYAGGVEKAIRQTKEYLSSTDLDLKIEVETRDLDELKKVLAVGGVDRVMLDNYSFEDMRTAVEWVGDKMETEASGGINEHTIREYAECGVDYISVGALTHSVYNLDLSLKAM